MFSSQDLKQIKKKGISIKDIEKQLDFFKKGLPQLNIIDAGTTKFGILKFDEVQIKEYVTLFENSKDSLKLIKFVPASGAATRMFKMLFELMNTYTGTQREYLKLIVDRSFNSLFYLYEHIKEFPFYEDLTKVYLENGKDIEACFEKQNYPEIIQALLFEDGLNYGNLPKGLIKFHKYSFGIRTAAEEHLVEGALYSNSKGKVKIHFTISPQHRKLFKAHVDNIKKIYQKKYGVKYYIGFSEQKSYTDTIAVDLDNNPFRNTDGTIVFRPGGHGALIYNLNKISADLIFMKNIDNVVPDYFKDDTITYKKVLAGKAIEIQHLIFDYLKQLKKSKNITETLIKDIVRFYKVELHTKFADDFELLNKEERRLLLINKLNRPLRVCGMVRNQGEPGGGPYLVRDNEANIVPQIVEGSQFNKNEKNQIEIIEKATHFNPVDIVCAVRDYRGRKFDLTKYIDEKAGFISQKSKDGKDLKAYELPGLWNGAMSNWNTVFIEVPITTFNPVKVINDLLRKEHQPIS